MPTLYLVNFEEADCNIIKYNKFFNPNNSKDVEIISELCVGRI